MRYLWEHFLARVQICVIRMLCIVAHVISLRLVIACSRVCGGCPEAFMRSNGGSPPVSMLGFAHSEASVVVDAVCFNIVHRLVDWSVAIKRSDVGFVN